MFSETSGTNTYKQMTNTKDFKNFKKIKYVVVKGRYCTQKSIAFDVIVSVDGNSKADDVTIEKETAKRVSGVAVKC